MCKTNLVDFLVEAAEYYGYECKDSQVLEFVSLRMDNGDFPDAESIDSVEVLDSVMDSWVDQFKLWLAEQE